MTQEGVEYLAETFQTRRKEQHHSRIADLDEVRENDWNLSVPRYVDTTEPETPVSVEKKVKDIEKLEKEVEDLSKELDLYTSAVINGGPDYSEGEYKEVKLGPVTTQIPIRWELKPVSEIFEIRKEGYSPDDSEETVYLYSMPAYDKGQEPVETVEKEVGSKKYHVPENTILFPKLNIRKRRFWRVNHNHEKKAICSTEFWPLVPKIDVCLDFYHQYFDSSEFMRNPKVSTSSSTNSHKRVKEGSFKNVKLPVPPISEQQRIATILTKTDNKMSLIKELVEHLNELKRGLMQDTLTGSVRVPPDVIK